MRPTLCLAVLTMPLLAATGTAGQAAIHLGRLSTALDLTDRGARRWLEQLRAQSDGEPLERLFALSLDGTVLAERRGERSLVHVDGEISELLLRQPALDVVLMHNHPANAGLSRADLSLLALPSVAAVVAIGHDRSVYMAAAGARFDRNLFEERQYATAVREVEKRMRTEWPVTRPRAVADAYVSHVVALSLERAGILDYWFAVRGNGSAFYAELRPIFGRVVTGAAERLKKGK